MATGTVIVRAHEEQAPAAAAVALYAGVSSHEHEAQLKAQIGHLSKCAWRET
jgi:predicted site-specific integrase-resolvase